MGTFINEYKNVFKRMIPLSIPNIDPDQLDKALDYSIQKRFKEAEMRINNNYKHITVNSYGSKLVDYILDKKPIMTPFGCLFTRHASMPNPFYEMVDSFVNKRQEYKKEMFKYPKGSEQFAKYNLLQLVAKVDANALYGTLGNYASIFYNIYTATAVTASGKGCISASICMFESLLANNVKFGSLNEVITFIDNIRQEERHFKDEDVIDENINAESCFMQLILTCGYRWVPNEKEMNIIWDIVNQLNQTELNRIYYKNNLYEFCSCTRIQAIIVDILKSLEAPFLDPNKPPKEIKDKIELLLDYVKEYVYYGYIYIDKLNRIETMVRDAVLITDTDSCIISLDAWYRFVLAITEGIDMKIKHTEVELMQKGEDIVPVVTDDKVTTYDYDFHNDEIIEIKKSANPAYTPVEDGVRHSIINIISYMVSQLILDYMKRYAKYYNSYDPARECMLIMKNEFLFKAIMLTSGKKNYASIQEVQEGNLVPKEASLAISGLPLDKVGIPKSTSNELKRIIYDDILNIEEVDQLKVIKELAILEKRIYESIQAGETIYYKPARIKDLSAYEDPMRIQGIKASYAYNLLHKENEESINLEKRNSVLIIKVDINKKNVDKIKDTEPEIYEKMCKMLNSAEFEKEINSIAIPIDMPVPNWIIPFIDYVTIIHDNLNSFPLESIGISRLGNKNITYSNILSL